jgi:hypothetical protein
MVDKTLSIKLEIEQQKTRLTSMNLCVSEGQIVHVPIVIPVVSLCYISGY